MKSIKVCEYSRPRSFHDDLILQDQASGERSKDQWSSGCRCRSDNEQSVWCLLNDLIGSPEEVYCLGNNNATNIIHEIK